MVIALMVLRRGLSLQYFSMHLILTKKGGYRGCQSGTGISL